MNLDNPIFPKIFDINTEKEKIRESIKQDILNWFSDKELEKLINPIDNRSTTEIQYYFNYKTGEFKAINLTTLSHQK